MRSAHIRFNTDSLGGRPGEVLHPPAGGREGVVASYWPALRTQGVRPDRPTSESVSTLYFSNLSALHFACKPRARVLSLGFDGLSGVSLLPLIGGRNGVSGLLDQPTAGFPTRQAVEPKGLTCQSLEGLLNRWCVPFGTHARLTLPASPHVQPPCHSITQPARPPIARSPQPPLRPAHTPLPPRAGRSAPDQRRPQAPQRRTRRASSAR